MYFKEMTRSNRTLVFIVFIGAPTTGTWSGASRVKLRFRPTDEKNIDFSFQYIHICMLVKKLTAGRIKEHKACVKINR